MVFNTRKGAWSKQMAATSLVKPEAIPFGKLHFIDTAYSEHIANEITVESIMKNKKKSKNNKLPSHLQHININAAGIDIGSENHFVAVPEGRDQDPLLPKWDILINPQRSPKVT